MQGCRKFSILTSGEEAAFERAAAARPGLRGSSGSHRFAVRHRLQDATTACQAQDTEEHLMENMDAYPEILLQDFVRLCLEDTAPGQQDSAALNELRALSMRRTFTAWDPTFGSTCFNKG